MAGQLLSASELSLYSGTSFDAIAWRMKAPSEEAFRLPRRKKGDGGATSKRERAVAGASLRVNTTRTPFHENRAIVLPIAFRYRKAMKNVWTVAIRSGNSCVNELVLPTQAWHLRRAICSISSHLNRWPCPAVAKRQSYVTLRQHNRSQGRDFSQWPHPHFRQSFILEKLKAYQPAAGEQGLSFRPGDLDVNQLRVIFGPSHPPARFANQLLRVLHGRRVDGTLDLPLPGEFDPYLRKFRTATSDGLQWLRKNFPIDEDEAIIQRIEREEAVQEKENPADLIRRGEALGLYRADIGPQSGQYQAQKSETEGDVFGVSQLEKVRAENIEKFEAEEEELQQEIQQTQQEVREKYGELAKLPENAVEIANATRPPNLFETHMLRAKMKATSKLTLDSPEIANQSTLRRLLPSFLFVTVLSGLCYAYAQYWTPPKRSDRMFPDVSLTFATIGGIIGANVMVFMLWRFPPAWRLLNKYFISIPAKPVPLSMIGNVFSHQSFKHLTYNMAWILLLGLSLHEDIGRGNFLALYVASGAISSLFSVTSFALRGMLFTSSVGASGAVSGVVAAYCILHASDKFTFFLIPKEWQDTITFTGTQFFVFVIGLEVMKYLFRPTKSIDYAAHIGGYAVGAAVGWLFKTQDGDGGHNIRKKRRLTWIDHYILGKKDEEGNGWYESAQK